MSAANEGVEEWCAAVFLELGGAEPMVDYEFLQLRGASNVVDVLFETRVIGETGGELISLGVGEAKTRQVGVGERRPRGARPSNGP
jgi:hypothetical protein